MAFFDISLSEIVETGADAFVAAEEADAASSEATTAVAKTAETKILAQAKAASDTAVLWAKDNEKTLMIVGGVLLLGYVALTMKRGK